jgi:hypothetical protein
VRKKFREDTGFVTEPFFDKFFMKIPAEKSAQIRTSMKRLAVSSFKLGHTLTENFSEQALNALDAASKKLEEINSKLKGEPKNE